MRTEILTELQSVEAAHRVRIPYACESGSRAWGFSSTDSDYDVRFVYLHSQDWYLSVDLERKRDVIESAICDPLDITGWDLRKALRLLRKGNPALIEWLGSPIVYLDRLGLADRMRRLASEYYSPVASMYHYLHMAQGNFRDYLRGPVVSVKKYLYVLRPLLAIRYLERGLGVVPTEFGSLIDTVVDSPVLKDEIDALVAAKRVGHELDRGPRMEPISRFVESELERLEGIRFGEEATQPNGPIDKYNQLFRTSLADAWS